eukprot:CAMPEP_0184011230 /NCGR_PEP_ID=MMETSP0954-20121128/3702_1 /TAXON_ID=627963 /ORGANISM="Aplanochytrium sp, Strain PBS07" /LENGTH=428 /DNA_ID=CAMNT_0026291005 /DNA_START=64 /DNA_END=1346 /DNA_ORIENTATION=+
MVEGDNLVQIDPNAVPEALYAEGDPGLPEWEMQDLVAGLQGPVARIQVLLDRYFDNAVVQREGCKGLMIAVEKELLGFDRDSYQKKYFTPAVRRECVSKIIRAMTRFPGDSELQEIACMALRNFHTEVNDPRRITDSSGLNCIGAISDAMRNFPYSVQVQVAGCEALVKVLLLQSQNNPSIFEQRNPLQPFQEATDTFPGNLMIHRKISKGLAELVNCNGFDHQLFLPFIISLVDSFYGDQETMIATFTYILGSIRYKQDFTMDSLIQLNLEEKIFFLLSKSVDGTGAVDQQLSQLLLEVMVSIFNANHSFVDLDERLFGVLGANLNRWRPTDIAAAHFVFETVEVLSADATKHASILRNLDAILETLRCANKGLPLEDTLRLQKSGTRILFNLAQVRANLRHMKGSRKILVQNNKSDPELKTLTIKA